MCGRYTLTQAPDESKIATDYQQAVDLRPKYNIAPTQLAPITPQHDPKYLHYYRWGLVPHWAKDIAIGSKLINARAETAWEKPSFRHAMQGSRCLVWADGFYEWQKEGKARKPFRILMQSGKVFPFAGLTETWQSPGGEILRSFTILTTTPNALMKPIHDRMPVILSRADALTWLNPISSYHQLNDLLKPFPTDQMRAYRVSNAVGNVRNDEPSLVEEVE